MADLCRKPVIVLGMHRSGTSLLAELVHRWGAYVGQPPDLFPGDEFNPRGYWESKSLVTFNQNLLLAVDSDGWRPPADEVEGALMEYAEAGEFRDAALQLLTKMHESGEPWLWKDPRLAVLLPFWRRLWGEVAYVIPVRNPLEVANSLMLRDTSSFSAALLLWQRYISSILRFTSRDQTRLFIEYESLIVDTNHQVLRLCQFLEDQVRFQGNDAQYVSGGVDPSLRRSESKREDVQTSSLTYEQKELYKALRRLVYDSEAEVPAACLRLPENWRAYLEDRLKAVPLADRGVFPMENESAAVGHPRKKTGLVVHAASGQFVIYENGSDSTHYLNSTATLILEFCDGDHSPAEIAELVQEAYGLPSAPLSEVNGCLADLRTRGLIR